MDIPETNPSLPGAWEWPDAVRQRSQASGAARQFSMPKAETAEPSTGPTPTPTPTAASASASASASTQSAPGSAHSKRKTWKPRTCRICFETVQPTFSQPLEHLPDVLQPPPRVTYESESGRLLSPCRCKGSSKYVHEVCLQQWRFIDSSRRNYYHCPTCGFNYRISRIGWAGLVKSAAAQIGLTALIFLVTIFVLGFISDFVIDLCLDPWGSLWRGVTFQGRDKFYFDEYEEPSGWIEHFSKGFASLGLLSFFKAMLASPLQIWRTNVGGRNRNTGRDRLGGITWIVIIIGAATFAFTVWKGVRLWTRRTLERAGEKVMDVQGDDDDDND